MENKSPNSTESVNAPLSNKAHKKEKREKKIDLLQNMSISKSDKVNWLFDKGT